jgi:hypothetical protein
MRLRVILIALLLAASTAPLEAKPVHHCAANAVKQAEKLLKFHMNNDDRAAVDADSVKLIGTVAALAGKGRFDVLEVEGSVYKGDYRMRMIYAQLAGDCVLMGQEIFERSDPY